MNRVRTAVAVIVLILGLAACLAAWRFEAGLEAILAAVCILVAIFVLAVAVSPKALHHFGLRMVARAAAIEAARNMREAVIRDHGDELAPGALSAAQRRDL
jgi:uncharacterized transporter YbjL